MADLTTELDAINLMLDAIGASPVVSLDDPSVDVAKARMRLAQVSREVQAQGWHWNTDTRYSLARTIDGEYILPLNVIRIDASGDFPMEDVVARSGKLWDRENRTTVFTKDLTFDIVWLLDFADLPEAARNYITLRASRRFQEKALGSDSLSRFDRADEAQALAILREAEADTEDNNVLSGSWAVARVLRRTPGDTL
jgi:hypothetical protein